MKSPDPSPHVFRLHISYSQIAVFCAGLQAPFSDWTQGHVDQGFAWRPESVSFKCLSETGEVVVSVTIKDQLVLRPDTIRAIQVPFIVPPSNQIEIASITDGAKTEISQGAYLLIFETGISSAGIMWCDFSFIESKESSFAILRVDNELHPSAKLVLTAEPA